MTAPRRGVVLFAHGARDPRWAEPFAAITARLRQARPEATVVLAFLEMMQPDLAAATRSLIEGGATHVDVVPLFLGQGGHLRNDLPPLVEALRGAHPGLIVVLHPAIGEDAAVIAAIAAAAAATVFGE